MARRKPKAWREVPPVPGNLELEVPPGPATIPVPAPDPRYPREYFRDIMAIPRASDDIGTFRVGLLCAVDKLPAEASAHFTIALAALDTARNHLTLAYARARECK
jgi:hypothetical protein